MMPNPVSSISLHLQAWPDPVQVEAVKDTTCGIYPVYYTAKDGQLHIASSVSPLVLLHGDLHEDTTFTHYEGGKVWHEGPSTIDARVKKLPAFGYVTMRDGALWERDEFEHANYIGGTRRFVEQSAKAHEAFVEQSAKAHEAFVARIEKMYPGDAHVVLLGGVDSQTIMLVPKVKPANWHVLSMEPNASLVWGWLKRNGIEYGRFFRRRVTHRPGIDFVHRIVWATDCMADPRHYRSGDFMVEIARAFGGDVIFWAGTLGDAIQGGCHSRAYVPTGSGRYWNSLLTRGPGWQGMAHQNCLRQTGCPMLSLYHSPEIWRDVYTRTDMSALPRDVRQRVGVRLHGRQVEWLRRNPHPPNMHVPKRVRAGCRGWYVDELKRKLKEA